jgi:hypothetical protein
MTQLDYLNLGPDRIAGLLALLAVAIGLSVLGTVTAGRTRLREGDMVYGWAAVITVFTVFGAIGGTSFSGLALAIGALAIAVAGYLIFAKLQPGPVGAPKLLALAVPFLIIGAAMTPTQWDELTQWLPNARFLFEHDSFPRPDLPKSPSVFPAYPYGVPLIIYLTSRITGFLVENAAALFHFLLYLSYGLLVARLAVTVARAADTATPILTKALNAVRPTWGFCAIAALTITVLNPTYVSRLVFSAYADAPTAITIGLAAVLSWLMLDASSARDDARARSYAWQAGLALTAAIGLKQVNLVFLLSLIVALAVIVARDPEIHWRPVLRLLPRLLILPIATYLLWRHYVSVNISGGELTFRPIGDWYFALIGDLLSRMALIATKKSGYFGIMTIAVILGVRAFWRPGGSWSRLTLITATLFLCYNGFLFLAYIGSFGRGDTLRAASYWRYNTHLGGVALVFAVCGLAHLWRRYIKRPAPALRSTWAAGVLIALVVVMPLVMAKKLRFDKHPRYDYARAIAKGISQKLTAKDRLLLIDLADDGQYQMIMRYSLYGAATIAGEINAWTQIKPAQLRKRTDQGDLTHLWMYEALPPLPAVTDLSLSLKTSYLLKRQEKSWKIIGQWPHDKTQ